MGGVACRSLILSSAQTEVIEVIVEKKSIELPSMIILSKALKPNMAIQTFLFM